MQFININFKTTSLIVVVLIITWTKQSWKKSRMMEAAIRASLWTAAVMEARTKNGRLGQDAS